MLLTPTRRRHQGHCSFLAWWVLLGAIYASGQSVPCSAELPVYGPKGEKLDFKIVAVTPEGDTTNLLGAGGKAYHVASKGIRLYFPKSMIGARPLRVVLADDKGTRITARVPLTGCNQRFSQRRGILDTGADVAWSTARGRLIGCTWNGDWWIRAFPMFGGTNVGVYYAEAPVDARDGSFTVEISSLGERFLFVVGKDRDPLHVFAADFVSGGKNDLGQMDLSGRCPK
jgi:hypothetical protein